MSDIPREEINRKIHEFMGKCWHESEPEGDIRTGGYRCKHCGDNEGLSPFPPEWDKNGNPDYCSDSSPRSLLDTVRNKVIGQYGFNPLMLELRKTRDETSVMYDGVEALICAQATTEQIARACYRVIEEMEAK